MSQIELLLTIDKLSWPSAAATSFGIGGLILLTWFLRVESYFIMGCIASLLRQL